MSDIQIIVYMNLDGEYIVRTAENASRRRRIRSAAEKQKKPNTEVKAFSLDDPSISRFSRSLEELFEFAVFINGHGREGGKTHEIDDLLSMGVIMGLEMKKK